MLATVLFAPAGRSGEGRLDPTWPPVLIAFVVVAVSAVVLMSVVVLRRLRIDGRRHGGAR